MRRSEKIERFLDAHPRATERDLQKKFQCSYREAKTLLSQHNGEALEVVTKEASLIQSLFSSTKSTIITLLAIAIFWRFFYLLFFVGNEVLHIPLLDAEYYLRWADEIVNDGWLGTKAFFTEPFYAYFLAFLMKLFGKEALGGVALGVQFFLGALFPVLMYWLGRKFFDEKIGRVSGLIAAFYGPFLFYESLLLKTSFEVYSLPLFLWAFWQALQKPTRIQFALAGVVLGLVALIKGNVMIFLPIGWVLIFVFLREQKRMQRFWYGALFTLGVLACIMPITARNYIVSQDIVPTNYSIGLVLYQGNWWGGDGSTALVPTFLRPHPRYEETDAVKMAESFVGRELKASEVSRFWIMKALEEVWSQPGHFLQSLGHKVLLLLNYRDYSDNYSYAYYRSQIPFLWILPSFFMVAVLGMGGLGVMFGRYFDEIFETGSNGTAEQRRLWQTKWMLATFFAGYVGVLLLTTINSRYRMPLVPFLIFFSSASLCFFYQRFYERTMIGMRKVLAIVVVAGIVVVLPLPIFKHLSFADAYHNIGYWYFEQGNMIRAQNYFQKAVKDDKEYAWSYRMMFQIALLDGRYDDAKKHLQKIIYIRPDDLSVYKDVAFLKEVEGLSGAEAHTNIEAFISEKNNATYDVDVYEGLRWLQEGNEDLAEESFRKSLENNDAPIAALMALANLKTKQNKDTEAAAYLQQAIDKNADLLPARYNLANIYIRNNDYSQVGELLAPVYEFAPELGETWYNYSVTLIRNSKTGEAVPVAEAYVERYKDDLARRDKVAKMQEFVKAAQEQQKTNPLPTGTK